MCNFYVKFLESIHEHLLFCMMTSGTEITVIIQGLWKWSLGISHRVSDVAMLWKWMFKTVQHHNLLHDESLSAAVTTLIHPNVCGIFYRNLTRSGTYKSPTKEHQTNPRFYSSQFSFHCLLLHLATPPFFIFFPPTNGTVRPWSAQHCGKGHQRSCTKLGWKTAASGPSILRSWVNCPEPTPVETALIRMFLRRQTHLN